MWRVIATFFAVIAIIYLSYLASKYIGKGLGRTGSSRYMRLIDQITLGQDRHIAIMQVGGKYLLVGVTSGQINVLSEIQDEDLFPLGPDEEVQAVQIPDFKRMMEKLGDLKKRGGRN
jgi:flagellar protein FliO/FliZ